jgi:hypothetical protein
MPQGPEPAGRSARTLATVTALAGAANAPVASKAAAAIAINEFFFDILMGISPVGSRNKYLLIWIKPQHSHVDLG